MVVPELARALEEGPPAVVLITGDEALLVDEASRALEAALTPDCRPEAFNVTQARAGEQGAVDAIGAARTLPMMAARRLVVVRDLHEGTNGFFEAVKAYLDHPSDTTTLVLVGRGFPPVRKGGRNWGGSLRKPLAAHGLHVQFSSKKTDPVRFVVDRATALGHSVSPPVARVLVELVGRDLGRLARELEKACLYVAPGAPLDEPAVIAACSALAEADAWALTGAVVRGDAAAALGTLHRLLEAGEEPHRLMGLLTWQARMVLRVAEGARRGDSPSALRQSLRAHPATIQSLYRAVQARRPPGAAALLGRCARAGREMNRHPAGSVRILEGFVLDWVGLGERVAP